MDLTEKDAQKPLLHVKRLRSSTGGCLHRLGSFLKAHTKNIALVLGPLLFLVLYFVVEMDVDETTQSGPMLAAMVWMFTWWVFEAIPLAVTALVPLFLFPLLEIETASSVSKAYTNDTVFLILGSFILANAVRFHNLHKRLALHIVLLFGSDPRLLLFGFCLGCGFVSMWVDNAAAAAMLMPMAIGVQQKIHSGFQSHGLDATTSPSQSLLENQEQKPESENNQPSQLEREPSPAEESISSSKKESSKRSQLERKSSLTLEKHLSRVLSSMDAEDALNIELNFCRGVAIAVAISVTIGGMSTLTGNSVNLILSGIWETDYPNESSIGYLQWMLFAFPLSVILLFALWVLLCIFFCPPSAVKPVSASLHSLHLEDELQRLGRITSDQIAILVIFLVLIVFWMTKSITGSSSGWATLFDDYPGNGSVTILMAVLLFVLPNPADLSQKLMNWSQCKDIPWNVVLLVGGGFALADGIKESGLSDIISEEMSLLKFVPYWAITPTIGIITGIITEFTSNSATASIFVPLMAELALSVDQHPLFLMVSAAIGSQFSYMLPTATGPNALAFTIECLRVKDMALLGIFLKIIAIVVLSILMPTLGVVVFNTNSSVQT